MKNQKQKQKKSPRPEWDGGLNLQCLYTLQILLHAVGSGRGIGADGGSELDVVLLAEHVQPVQELLGLRVHVVAGDLAQIVDKHMGNIVVAGAQAADKAAEQVVAVQLILLRVNETDMIVDIICHVAVGLNANHVAGLILRRVVDQLNEMLGLAGTLHTHNQSDHSKSLLSY